MKIGNLEIIKKTNPERATLYVRGQNIGTFFKCELENSYIAILNNVKTVNFVDFTGRASTGIFMNMKKNSKIGKNRNQKRKMKHIEKWAPVKTDVISVTKSGRKVVLKNVPAEFNRKRNLTRVDIDEIIKRQKR